MEACSPLGSAMLSYNADYGITKAWKDEMATGNWKDCKIYAKEP